MQVIRRFMESYPLLMNILWFILFSVILYLIRRFILNRLYGKMKGTENWYVTRKITTWLNYLIIFLLFLYVFGENLSNFSTAIGLAGAGITYALREVIVSFAGWFAIMFGDFFTLGDRVLLGGIKGDVVDIGLLRTTLMEIGEWVEADQYTGRIVRVANSYIFNSPVYNYTANFHFLWDEIHIPIQFDSDVKLAKEILLEVADEVTGNYNEKAETEWIQMQRRYKLEEASLKNQVYVTFNENWIEVSLRYIVDYKARRGIKDQIFMKILERFEAEKGHIEIAPAKIEILQRAEYAADEMQHH